MRESFKMPAPPEVPVVFSPINQDSEDAVHEDIELSLKEFLDNLKKGVPDDYKVSKGSLLVRIDKFDQAILTATPKAQNTYNQIKEVLRNECALNDENFVHERINHAIEAAFYDNFDYNGDALDLRLAFFASLGMKLSGLLFLFFLCCVIPLGSKLLLPAGMCLYGIFLLGVSTTKRATLILLFAVIYPYSIYSVFFT